MKSPIINAMMSYRFTYYGKPVPKGRHRRAVNRKTGRVFEHSDPKTAKAEQDFVLQALPHKPDKPIEGSVSLSALIVVPPLRNFLKWQKKIIDAGGLLPCTKRPDLDNYIKLIKDALNKIYWMDDAQVVLYGPTTGKFYGNPPRIEVTVEEVEFEYSD